MANAQIRLQQTKERIEAVEQAIVDATTGAAVTMAGASLTRQRLPELTAELARLKRQERDIEREIAGVPVTAAATPSFPATGTR